MHACTQACDGAGVLTFFCLCSQLKLGKNGIEEYLPLGELSAYEQTALDEAVTILQGNIKKVLTDNLRRLIAFDTEQVPEGVAWRCSR